MDIKSLVKNFDVFQDAFDKMSVNANIMNDNFAELTSEGNNIQESDEIFN